MKRPIGLPRSEPLGRASQYPGWRATFLFVPFDRIVMGAQAATRLGKCDAGRRSKLLSDLFADFDARGVGLCMDDNLPQDALYRRDATD